LPLPVTVVGDLLGVPRADHHLLARWNPRLARRNDRDVPTIMAAHEAMQEFQAYVGELSAEHRRSAAQTELLTLMLDADGELLSDPELTAMFVNFLVAGHHTTTSLLGRGLLELLRHPEQWQRLAADPTLVSAGIEELLRHVSPAQWVPAVPAVDIELEDGVLPQGHTVSLVVAAANRDPRVFERPDVFDVMRGDAREHISFGWGPHHCLGASLARLEAQVVFETLARRFPRLELAEEPDEWVGGALLRRPKRYLVRFR
jgi:cytochrome P450